MILILLMLTSLTSCFMSNKATFSIEIAANKGLNMLSDTLFFEASSNAIEDKNIANELAQLFKSEGFEIKNNRRGANVIAHVSKIEEERTYQYDRKVLDTTYTYQWIENPDTGLLERRPVSSDTFKTVQDYANMKYYILTVLFKRGEEAIVEAEMRVVADDYNSNPKTFMKKLFETIKSGNRMKDKVEYWYNDKK